jgi:class 3 adenylate cyclase
LLGLPETIQVLFPSYVRDAVRRLRLASAPPSSSGVRVAVGFVDLVGSTTLLQRLSGAELARAVGEFETAAYDLALSHDGRIVKFIGDEAMFVSSDPESACAIGVELCEVVADHALLDDARGAVALGDAIAQSGDYYGPTVSLVSRLTGIAAAGQLLASSTLAQELTARGAAYEFASVGAQSLRGFDEPVEAFSVHRKLG